MTNESSRSRRTSASAAAASGNDAMPAPPPPLPSPPPASPPSPPSAEGSSVSSASMAANAAAVTSSSRLSDDRCPRWRLRTSSTARTLSGVTMPRYQRRWRSTLRTAVASEAAAVDAAAYGMYGNADTHASPTSHPDSGRSRHRWPVVPASARSIVLTLFADGKSPPPPQCDASTWRSQIRHRGHDTLASNVNFAAPAGAVMCTTSSSWSCGGSPAAAADAAASVAVVASHRGSSRSCSARAAASEASRAVATRSQLRYPRSAPRRASAPLLPGLACEAADAGDDGDAAAGCDAGDGTDGETGGDSDAATPAPPLSEAGGDPAGSLDCDAPMLSHLTASCAPPAAPLATQRPRCHRLALATPAATHFNHRLPRPTTRPHRRQRAPTLGPVLANTASNPHDRRRTDSGGRARAHSGARGWRDDAATTPRRSALAASRRAGRFPRPDSPIRAPAPT
mmetsp:Transcript_22040/g.77254  ORF Transcript_22040/g.77254 Transcript_22040/m.77254 type:complete len:454 (-) Transcript_22040:205-1566(-)